MKQPLTEDDYRRMKLKVLATIASKLDILAAFLGGDLGIKISQIDETGTTMGELTKLVEKESKATSPILNKILKEL